MVEAKHVLADAYHCFSEGFDTPDLSEARQMLAVLNELGKP